MRKNKIEPLRNTVHDQTIQKMMDENPALQRGNFYKTCLAAFPDVEEIHEYFTGSPDIFMVDKDNRIIIVSEIEDYHKLSPEKLRKYAMLWSSLDFYGIDFLLFSYGRHGGNKQLIDLLYWYGDIVKNHRKPAGSDSLLTVTPSQF